MPRAERPEAVLGLDNVALHLPIAGPGSRALSAFLDYLLVGLMATAVIVTAITVGVVSRAGSGFLFAMVLVGLFVLEYGYFAGFEIATGGQTPGKKALGLRVVNAQGGRPANGALLIRNAVRMIDILVGVLLMATDAKSRRLGDRLAGTLVLHTRRREPDVLVRRLPTGWGPREAAVLEGFLHRSRGLDLARAEALARQLLVAIERDDPDYLSGSPPSFGPVERLRHAAEREPD